MQRGRVLDPGEYETVAELTASGREELADRFGPLPAPVVNLLAEGPIRLRAGRLKIPYVGVDGGRFTFKLHGWTFEALRAQLLGLFMQNAAAFVRVIDAKVKKEQPAAPAA